MGETRIVNLTKTASGVQETEVLVNDERVGKIRIKIAPGARLRIGEIRYAERTSSSENGAMAKGYLALLEYFSLDVLRSGIKMSFSARTFWKKLRPPEGFKKYEARCIYAGVKDPEHSPVEVGTTESGEKFEMLENSNWYCLVRDEVPKEKLGGFGYRISEID